IAAGYLRDAAAKWYDKNQGNYQGWHVQGNPNSFVNAFLNYFATDIEENEMIEQVTVKALILKEIISTGGTDIGQTPYVNHQIPLKLGVKPIAHPPYRLNQERKDFLEKKIDKIYNLKQIHPEMVSETLSTEVFWDYTRRSAVE
ncbi:13254_t:CDS:2, partial [Funneliformis geosporum]